MTTAPALVRRKCCPGGAASFVEPPDVESSMAYRFIGGDAPILEELRETPPDEQTAWHEAGHAVIAHAVGSALDLVTIRAPARVIYAEGGDLTPVESIARSHGGPVGEMARLRFWSTGWQEDDDEYLCRVEAFQFGGCDGCQMAMAAWGAVGFSAGIDAARAVLREGRLLALQIAQEQKSQSAIRAVATELMRDHALSGKRAHSIIEPFLKFGKFKNDAESKKTTDGKDPDGCSHRRGDRFD